jgi:hypothetical protein
MNRILTACGAAVLVAGLAGVAQAAPFNGSLGSTADFSDAPWWVVDPADSAGTTDISLDTSGIGYLGADAVAFGSVGYTVSFSQTFDTMPGSPLTVSFYLNNLNQPIGDPEVHTFSASFDGTTLFSLDGGGPTANELYSFNVTGLGTDTLTFTGENWESYWNLSVISVGPPAPAPVPAPAAIGLFLVGLSGLAAVRRRAA